MPHTHAHSKAEAIHEAIEHFAEEHHHQPDTHEKARLVSDAIKEWEHEEVDIRHEAEDRLTDLLAALSNARRESEESAFVI